MPPDIPAAHSMDTRWFAVDRDGRVARFETSESGALPWAAESRDFDEWPLEALAAAPAVASGLLAPEIEPHLLSPEHALIVLTADPDARLALSMLVADLEVADLSHTSVLATSSRLPPGLLRRLSAHPRVAQIVPRDEVQRWLAGDDSPLFQFRHDYPGAPGAYRRVNRPRGPSLSVEALPEPAASVVRRVSLPLRFADTRRVDLAEHFRETDCHLWGGLSLRG